MKLHLTIIFLLITTVPFAQINMVSNPSFEMLYGCPNSVGQIDSAIGWHPPLGGGGAELNTTCCIWPALCGVPSQTNFNTFQYPHSGNNYAGLIVIYNLHPNDSRQYIQSKLINGLSEANIYCVKFYASLSNQSHAYIKTLGAYFDNGSVSVPNYLGLALVIPQIYNSSQLLNDTLNWMKIEGFFVSNGTEDYITIGNFFLDSLSGVTVNDSTNNWGAYYYIDDVSVIDVSLPVHAGNDTLIHPGDSAFIGRQPEVGLDEDCIWFVNGVPVDTVAGMWIKPDSNTTYILEQNICGNISYDTVTVTVSHVGIEQYLQGNNFIHVFPNPVTNEFMVDYSLTDKGYFELYDLIGIQRKTIILDGNSKTKTINVTDINNGLYFYSITDKRGDKIQTGKVVIIK